MAKERKKNNINEAAQFHNIKLLLICASDLKILALKVT